MNFLLSCEKNISDKNYDIRKKLYDGGQCKEVANISPLLMDAPTVYVKSEANPLVKGMPQMNFGNMLQNSFQLKVQIPTPKMLMIVLN